MVEKAQETVTISKAECKRLKRLEAKDDERLDRPIADAEKGIKEAAETLNETQRQARRLLLR